MGLFLTIAPKLYSQYGSGLAVYQNKWMALLYRALNISEDNAFEDDSYSFEAKLLIAYLMVKDCLVNPLMDNLGVSFGSGSGSVKKIVTGPTEVERHTLSDDFKDIIKPGGLLDQFQSQICSLASVLGVHITGCKQETIPVIKVLRNGDSSYLHKEILTPEYLKR